MGNKNLIKQLTGLDMINCVKCGFKTPDSEDHLCMRCRVVENINAGQGVDLERDCHVKTPSAEDEE